MADTPPQPSGGKPNIGAYLGFCGIFYVVFIVILMIGYPLAQQYAAPIASLVFPINPNSNPIKAFLVTSIMYWLFVAIPLLTMKKSS